MTIITTSPVQGATEPRTLARHSAAAGPGFMVPTAPVPGVQTVPEQARPQQARNVSRLTDTSVILALQEEVGGDARRGHEAADREARQRGQDILEALAALQKDMLAGVGLEGSLSRLSALVEMPSSALDSGLLRAIAAIRLRARLEMLRLTPKKMPQHARIQPLP